MSITKPNLTRAIRRALIIPYMAYDILSYESTPDGDDEVTSLLIRVFVEAGYPDKSTAEKAFAAEELRRRGDIITARSPAGDLLGMVVWVCPASLSRQIAMEDEAEIHLLAVSPAARGQGIASRLIAACEQRSVTRGYFKVVLSTQPIMSAARHVYEQLGYQRNPTRDWSKGKKTYLAYEKSISQEDNKQRASLAPHPSSRP